MLFLSLIVSVPVCLIVSVPVCLIVSVPVCAVGRAGGGPAFPGAVGGRIRTSRHGAGAHLPGQEI